MQKFLESPVTSEASAQSKSTGITSPSFGINVSPTEQFIILTTGQLQDMLTQAAKKAAHEAIRPLQDRIDSMSKEIDRQRLVAELYIAPLEEIFSDDDVTRSSARKAIACKREKDRERIVSIGDIQIDIPEINSKLDVQTHKHKPGEITEKRLQKTDRFLVARGNAPVPFSEMSRLQEFKSKYRDQDMTKLGRVYKQFPDRYEIRNSRFGGKTIRLTASYFKHLTKMGD